jgi:hypothetical protein
MEQTTEQLLLERNKEDLRFLAESLAVHSGDTPVKKLAKGGVRPHQVI